MNEDREEVGMAEGGHLWIAASQRAVETSGRKSQRHTHMAAAAIADPLLSSTGDAIPLPVIRSARS